MVFGKTVVMGGLKAVQRWLKGGFKVVSTIMFLFAFRAKTRGPKRTLPNRGPLGGQQNSVGVHVRQLVRWLPDQFRSHLGFGLCGWSRESGSRSFRSEAQIAEHFG